MIRAIAAIDDKRGIATDDGIPWDLPTDREFTRKMTKGGNLLVGYTTYLELPDTDSNGRHFYVLHEPELEVRDGFDSVLDLNEFMSNPPEDLWIFGGAGVFSQTIDRVDELYLTRVKGDFRCTKIFPEFEQLFELSETMGRGEENGISYRFEKWIKKS